MEIKCSAGAGEPVELAIDTSGLKHGVYSFGVHWADGQYYIGRPDGSMCDHPITVHIKPKSTQHLPNETQKPDDTGANMA